ncbi:hypothetical protein L873DRAFT_1816002, partial [Choiromyces venosus 120613-1]
MRSFIETGQPPRHFAVFEPSSPSQRNRLVHESEVKVLDRALAFGDVVKRNLKSPMSGTVISVLTEVGVQHSFQVTSEPICAITGVPEAELYLAHEWNDGDLLIYKGCWIGIVEEVIDEVAVRLENGSVVVPEDSEQLEIPILSQEEEAAIQRNLASLAQGGGADVTNPPTEQRPLGPSRRTGTVPAPPLLSPGFTVTTTKANIRRGNWLYGAYNPNVDPTGVIVAVKTIRLGVRWLRQNVMLHGTFIPQDQPNTWLDLEDELSNLQRFCKSTGGFTNLDGISYTNDGIAFGNGVTGGGVLQVGDRVRFKDLPGAAKKYPGIRNIPKSDMMGFDVNTFGIVSTFTRVRVRWQDMTETVENSRDLTPYLNVDEQDVWPGEIVMLKHDQGDSRETLDSCSQKINPLPVSSQLQKDKVGVVQLVNSQERVANVRWFKSPKVEFRDGAVMPGFKTGELGDQTEDVSVYELLGIEALAVRRGDFVLVSPDFVTRPRPAIPEAPAGGSAGGNAHNQIHPLRRADIDLARREGADALHNNTTIPMLDNNLLMNLSAALGASSDPQLQIVGRQLNQIPLSNATRYPLRSPMSQNTSQPRIPPQDPYRDEPIDWMGEIVDLGTDGLITVRLGGLGMIRDIKVMVERLFIVFNDDMDFDDLSDDETGMLDNDLNFEGDSDSGSDWSAIANSRFAMGIGHPTPIVEEVSYEGGERLDSGKEEDWDTDDDMEVEVDHNSFAVGMDIRGVPAKDGEGVNISADNAKDGVQVTTLGREMEADRMELVWETEATKDVITDSYPHHAKNPPAPEAFSIPETSKQPPHFAVLDSPVPRNHPFLTSYTTLSDPMFLRRLNKEHKILSTSLPDGIMVRTWEARLDLMRVLIVGPKNTPYELAPFFFDLYFGDSFPQAPPQVYFHSWTGGVGRVNPNLYEDGKVCLSLLGTWHAERKNEAWSATGSTVLQVLVSLMGLVLVREPYYNEAGFGVFQGADEVSLASTLYSEKAYILTRGFVGHALENPMTGFEEEIRWLYLPHQGGLDLLKEVIRTAKEVVKRSECKHQQHADAADTSVEERAVSNVTAGALILLKKNLAALEEVVEKFSL